MAAISTQELLALANTTLAEETDDKAISLMVIRVMRAFARTQNPDLQAIGIQLANKVTDETLSVLSKGVVTKITNKVIAVNNRVLSRMNSN